MTARRSGVTIRVRWFDDRDEERQLGTAALDLGDFEAGAWALGRACWFEGEDADE